MSEVGFIYRIKNIINNKEYVGCTISTLKKRFEEHTYRCLKTDINTKLCNSMRKYGVENFHIDLIDECEVSSIYEKEKFFINEYNTFKDGLNSTYGGEGCLGYKHSKEIREKISKILIDGKSHKGKTYEEIYGDKVNEEKQKRSDSVKNSWDNMSIDEKENRIKNLINKTRSKSKYSVELIKKIKNEYNSGVSLDELLISYPEFKKSNLYAIVKNKRWKNV
jgi:group I intron endonuclease